MKRLHFILIILVVCLWSIPVFSQETPTENSILQIDPEKDLVHPGDTLDIDVVGSVEYDWRGTLTPEGFLSGLNFVDEPVFAQCKTESEISEAVAKGYSKLLREPKVVVKIIDRSKRPVSTVFGAVKNEQRFQIQRPVLLNELIILSGGLTDRASGEIQIFRPKNVSCAARFRKTQEVFTEDGSRERFVQTSATEGTETLNIKISDLLRGKENSNPTIYSGDIVTIFEAEPIYVIGGVEVPKRISSRSQTTLSRVIAGAGGFSKDSNPEQITIFRREGNDTKIIEANFDEIEKNADKDIVLQAFDVVDVGVKGRGKSKLAPIVKEQELSSKNNMNLPLKIID
jgi:protein involved in polysaccharide export with SLBB domain